ncbi:Phosphatidic acid phosphatase type 2/haloperoxidase [Penicillium brevicompactum]|uniref:Phosphatidic acid phosphatase type 2/haloperoxidase n=1 Tax=Penicillium brevicompactum TaxID=5074 RepID=A0A9W9U9P9_PENBR|nr:Phosphatidic acid phosphatase type 2/haloperoxidase [Penicillium brevicompactum]
MGKSKADQPEPDAGLKSLNHYSNRLPLWRYWPRQQLIPLIRYETPYLAWVQEKVRTPTLDSYFAFTANLGTHTFFMVFLPFLFWCGSPSMGRGLVHILASGVFWSGFLKDLLCLPRPLSPPLQRITMSGSAALEYGFPSTHSTNAVSVAVYALGLLSSPESTLSAQVTLLLQAVTYIYVVSIVLGRLYCGMHGMLDCTVGCAMGAAIGLVQYHYGPAFEDFIVSASVKDISLLAILIISLVRVHPEPADDCPCFDDSVAFAGVMLGVDVSSWHFAEIWDGYPPGSIPYDLESIGWIKTAIRLVLGVLCIFAWRTVTKPALLRILPPIFRTLEKLGLLLPRRFFTTASEYTTVPTNLKDHDVLPNISDIPNLMATMRHPRRRAISVGPQSEADAYETLAYREKRRRESQSGGNRASPVAEGENKPNGTPVLSRKNTTLDDYEEMMGRGSPSSSAVDVSPKEHLTPFPSLDFEAGKRDEKEVFSQIKKPRVRYDVEVVTKLIVYAGIPWVVVEVAPLLFHLIGLGVPGV